MFSCIGLWAQGEIDALRLSETDIQGTARGQAMGGAFGALGGDVTSVGINPAGLGIYISSEVNVTANYSSTPIETNWANNVLKHDNSKFNFANASYIGYYPTGNENFSAINFGFSYRRLKDFNRSYNAEGKGLNVSLSNYMAETTNNLNNYTGINAAEFDEPNNSDPYYRGNPWLSVLGWQGALFNEAANSPNKYESVMQPNETVNSLLRVSERGSIETYDFSLGTNINDLLYIGVTFSLTDINYHIQSDYRENFSGGNDYFTLSNYQDTEGGGYQFKIGAILRPADFLRLGIAYHSPTWYSLTDYYYGKASNNYDADYPSANTPEDHYPYRFRTPDSWIFSIAGIVEEKAAISVDYEFKNYSKMNIQDENGIESGENNYINEDFRLTTSTLRAGLEYRFTPRFSGRLGYAWIQNPYEKKFYDGLKEVMIVGTIPHYIIEGDANYITAGLGYHFTRNFYMDVAFVYKNQKDRLYAYSPVWNEQGEISVNSQPASFKNNAYRGLLTLGYRF
ncbi:MAG: outer membrane protein transport protein [Candidatus Azobacteroides sp.]|nr:outer membrane protein transport protein [Candidatus Azobacteroides sp.]